MQFLQRWLPRLLVLGAIGVVLAALFSDHKTAHGQVPLPQGGIVDLPEGSSKVYLDEIQIPDQGGDPRRLSGPLTFQVAPVGGGPSIALSPVTGNDGRELTERSQAIGSKDAIADVDAPAAGEYRVTGSYDSPFTASLSFGTDPFSAVMAEWRLWAGLIVLAFLISRIPRARYRPRDEVPNTSASSQPAPGFSPYRG